MSKTSTHVTNPRPKSQESSQMPPPAAQEASAQNTPGVAAGADTHATAAVVLPAKAQQESQAGEVDEHRGLGGLYSVIDGKRVLMERTGLDVTPI